MEWSTSSAYTLVKAAYVLSLRRTFACNSCSMVPEIYNVCVQREIRQLPSNVQTQPLSELAPFPSPVPVTVICSTSPSLRRTCAAVQIAKTRRSGDELISFRIPGSLFLFLSLFFGRWIGMSSQLLSHWFILTSQPAQHKLPMVRAPLLRAAVLGCVCVCALAWEDPLSMCCECLCVYVCDACVPGYCTKTESGFGNSIFNITTYIIFHSSEKSVQDSEPDAR